MSLRRAASLLALALAFTACSRSKPSRVMVLGLDGMDPRTVDLLMSEGKMPNFAKLRKDVCKRVSRWTGEYRYTIDRVFEDMILRCRELNLRLATAEEQATLEFTILLTVQTMNYLHSGRHRVAL